MWQVLLKLQKCKCAVAGVLALEGELGNVESLGKRAHWDSLSESLQGQDMKDH